jgi:hypothetical protein
MNICNVFKGAIRWVLDLPWYQHGFCSTKATYMIDFWMSPQKNYKLHLSYNTTILKSKGFFKEIFEGKLSKKIVYNLKLSLS